ncbi:MAG TPA: hypothetical protein PLQ95_01345 [Thiobacillus sp.]|nr:hypothetical protein [Thiobacillus sp.]
MYKKYTMSNPFRSIALSDVPLLSLCTASLASAAYSEPPGRVARLSHAQGAVIYSPAGETDWFGMVRNRRWTARDTRAELQVGSAAPAWGAVHGRPPRMLSSAPFTSERVKRDWLQG